MINNIAEFNVLTKIATHYRTLKSGLQIPVKSHTRSYDKVEKYLHNLKNQPNALNQEFGYIFNPNNNTVGDLIKGDKAYIKHRRLKNNEWFLHNHPSDSNLSATDLYNHNNMVFAIGSKKGSIYGANMKKRFFVFGNKINKDTFDKLRRKTFLKEYVNLLDDPNYKKLHNNFIKDVKNNNDNIDNIYTMLNRHYFYTNMANNNYMNYYSKLSDKDKYYVTKHRKLFDTVAKKVVNTHRNKDIATDLLVGSGIAGGGLYTVNNIKNKKKNSKI